MRFNAPLLLILAMLLSCGKHEETPTSTNQAITVDSPIEPTIVVPPNCPSIFGYNDSFIDELLKNHFLLHPEIISQIRNQWNLFGYQNFFSLRDKIDGQITLAQVENIFKHISELDCSLTEEDDALIVFSIYYLNSQSSDVDLYSTSAFINYFKTKITYHIRSFRPQKTMNNFAYLGQVLQNEKTISDLFLQVLNNSEIKIFPPRSDAIINGIYQNFIQEKIPQQSLNKSLAINLLNFIHSSLTSIEQQVDLKTARNLLDMGHGLFEKYILLWPLTDQELIHLHSRMVMWVDYDFYKIITKSKISITEENDEGDLSHSSLVRKLLSLTYFLSQKDTTSINSSALFDEDYSLAETNFLNLFKAQGPKIKVQDETQQRNVLKYIELYYKTLFHRLYLAHFLSVNGVIQSIEDPHFNTAMGMYRSQLSLALEAINLARPDITKLTIENLYPTLKAFQKNQSNNESEGIFEFKTEDEEEVHDPNFNSNTIKELSDGLAFPEIVFLKSKLTINTTQDLRFHPLHLILTCGHDLNIRSAKNIFGMWVETTPCEDLPLLLPNPDRGMRPNLEFFDYSKTGNVNQLWVLHHPGWAPEKNTTGSNGKNAANVIISSADEGLFLIPQILGFAQNAQDGLAGFDSPLVDNGQYNPFFGVIGTEEDTENIFGGVTVIGNRRFTKKIGRRNYNVDGAGNDTGVHHQPLTPQSYIHLSRGAGGDGGNGGHATAITIIHPKAHLLQDSLFSTILLNGKGGKGASGGLIGPAFDSLELFQGKDGMAGNPGSLVFKTP